MCLGRYYSGAVGRSQPFITYKDYLTYLKLYANSLIKMQIPYEKLEEEVLFELLKDIVTRDGTDYGWEEKSTEQKVSAAFAALKNGKACLYWDSESETASLQSADSKFE